MIRSLFILLIFVAPLKGFTQGMVLNEQLTWEQVLKKASSEKKPIFVDAYTTWCGPCKWMAKNVFPDAEAGKFYNSNFVSYKLDMEKGEGIEFAKKYEVKFFPTYLFFDKDGNLVHRSGGSKPVADFIVDGKNALNPDKQLVTLSKKFKSDPTDKSVVKNYALALLDAGESNADAAESYFNLADEKEKISNEAFMIYSQLSDLNTPSFTFMKTNSVKFTDVEEKDVKEAVLSKYVSKVLELGKNKQYNQFTSLQESIEKDLGKLGWKEMTVNYYGAADDFKNIMKYSSELFSDPAFKNASMMNNLAWRVFETEEATEEDIKTALDWSKKSIELEKLWYSLDTQANLLYRLKKYDEAKKVAEEAIALAESIKEDAKDTKELLRRIEEEKK